MIRGNAYCWECGGEGLVVRMGKYGKVAVPCPKCEDREIIREAKERRAEVEKALKALEKEQGRG